MRYLLLAAMAALGLLLLLLRSAELGVPQAQEPVLGASPLRRGGAALEGLEGVGGSKTGSGAGGAPWERESADSRRDWAYDDGADGSLSPGAPCLRVPGSEFWTPATATMAAAAARRRGWPPPALAYSAPSARSGAGLSRSQCRAAAGWAAGLVL